MHRSLADRSRSSPTVSYRPQPNWTRAPRDYFMPSQIHQRGTPLNVATATTLGNSPSAVGGAEFFRFPDFSKCSKVQNTSRGGSNVAWFRNWYFRKITAWFIRKVPKLSDSFLKKTDPFTRNCYFRTKLIFRKFPRNWQFHKYTCSRLFLDHHTVNGLENDCIFVRSESRRFHNAQTTSSISCKAR